MSLEIINMLVFEQKSFYDKTVMKPYLKPQVSELVLREAIKIF